jgi:hypothetical protein
MEEVKRDKTEMRVVEKERACRIQFLLLEGRRRRGGLSMCETCNKVGWFDFFFFGLIFERWFSSFFFFLVFSFSIVFQRTFIFIRRLLICSNKSANITNSSCRSTNVYVASAAAWSVYGHALSSSYSSTGSVEYSPGYGVGVGVRSYGARRVVEGWR